MSEKKPDVDDDDLLTIAEACKKLSCGTTKIYDLAKENQLELVKFGRGTRVTARSLKKLIRDLIRDSRGAKAATGGG